MSPPPPIRNVYLSFQGVGFASGYRQAFDVLCGDNPPTITGGYANWTNIKRPLQRSLTIFQGYDPVQMTVDVRFGTWRFADGGWRQADAVGISVEKDIGKLEWMAGSNFHSGPSPVVYVWSHSAKGGDTDLVPPQYANRPWIVTGLQWGQAWRNPSGYRIWQEANITLSSYLNLSAPPKPDTTTRGGYFVSKRGRDTALLIASAPSARSPTVDHRILAKRILSDAKNNPCKRTGIRLERKSINWQIRHGVAVFVPTHQSL